MDNETLFATLVEMICGMRPHGWLDNTTAQYYAEGTRKFYNVTFSKDLDKILDIKIL